MKETTNISIRMDTNLKKEAEELFESLGLNMTTAMTMFLKQAVQRQAIPFRVSRGYNAKMLAAMEEAEELMNDKSSKSYTSMEELLADLNDEI